MIPKIFFLVFVVVAACSKAEIVVDADRLEIDVLPGESVLVTTSIRNTSDNDVVVTGYSGCRPVFLDPDFKCNGASFVADQNVTTSDGQSAAQSDILKVSANDSLRISLDLEETCRFREPGRYEARIVCGKTDRLSTDTITINVQQPARADDLEVWEKFVRPCRSDSLLSCLSRHSAEVLERYPKSEYAGYLLAAGETAFPYGRVLGGLREPAELVTALKDGAFTSQYPETTLIVEDPEAAIDGRRTTTVQVNTESTIRTHHGLVNDFLVEHPDFAQRDRLEAMAAIDALALGDSEEALHRWNWIADNSLDTDLARQANVYLECLE